MSKTLEKYKPRSKIIRYLLGYLVLFLGTVLTKISIKGRHNIPSEGSFIIAINHFHRIDPPFVIYGIQRPINFLMASDQIVEAKLMWGPWLYGFISTNRQNVAPSTIKQSIKALARGEIIGVFPEGASTDNKLRAPKKGAVFFAQKTKAPILPVSIIGLENVSQKWFHGVRPRVEINIGKPFKIKTSEAFDKKTREDILRRLGDDMMCRIAALLPEEYHGLYKGDERVKKYTGSN
jgi:1-acyl-sn-glycerol-3-phosphate acyltransferase